MVDVSNLGRWALEDSRVWWADEYVDLYGWVMNGERVMSRYGSTRERLMTQLRFHPGDVVRRRGMNVNLGLMELLQFVGGYYDLTQIRVVAPRANLELFTAGMSYGLRTGLQLTDAVGRLRADPGTRQAIVMVNGSLDARESTPACTNSLQFFARVGELHTVVSMRSWDLLKGLPYDMVMFGGMAQAVAGYLGLDPGVVSVTAGSLHVYEQDDVNGLTPLSDLRTFSIDWPACDRWNGVQVFAAGVATEWASTGKLPEKVAVIQ